MSDLLDCVVIGGGPAGLTAAIYLARYRRRFRLIDGGSSRASWIPLSRNYPGFPEGVGGDALLARMRAQAQRYGAPLFDGRVEGLRIDPDGFVLDLDNGQLRARKVILATGVVENEPDLPDCVDAVKRGLLRICPICDGFEGAGKSVGVLGASDHAAAEALFLRTFSDDVSLVLIGDASILAADRREALARAGVPVLETGIEHIRIEDGAIHAFSTRDGGAWRFDTLYSAFGVTPQSQLAQALGARFSEDGRLVVDDHQETSVPGFYAAGDIVRGLNQIAVATGEAALAATAVHNALEPVLA